MKLAVFAQFEINKGEKRCGRQLVQHLSFHFHYCAKYYFRKLKTKAPLWPGGVPFGREIYRRGCKLNNFSLQFRFSFSLRPPHKMQKPVRPEGDMEL